MIYEKSKLPDCLCAAIQKKFEFKIFRRICILAGCDYLQGGLKGIGLKNAELFFAKISTDDMETVCVRYLIGSLSKLLSDLISTSLIPQQEKYKS